MGAYEKIFDQSITETCQDKLRIQKLYISCLGL